MVDENTTPEVTEQTATIKVRIESLTDAGIVGQTIAELRENFGSIFNISPNASPVVKFGGTGTGQTVDEDYVVEAGDVVNFVLALGEKG